MPTLQQTYSTQPHQKVLSSLERTNTHLLKNTRHTDPVKWRIPCDMISSFDKNNIFTLLSQEFPQHHHIRFVYHGGIQCCQINQSRFSESCPIPSLITERGICLPLATLAHEWRATYIVKDEQAPTFSLFLLAFCSPSKLNFILQSFIFPDMNYNRKQISRIVSGIFIHYILHAFLPSDGKQLTGFLSSISQHTII